jgi:hypothetical protein
LGDVRTEALRHLSTTNGSPSWHFLTRVAFRFGVVYFGLFCLLYVQVMFVLTGVLGALLPPGAQFWQMSALSPVTEWVGRQVFGIDAAIHPDSRSGDQAAMWVLMFNLLVLAVGATALWSILDRRRTRYPRLHAWFTVFTRICLGGQLLLYGAVKVIPVQMPAPPLTSLLRPFGQLSPTWVLWLQVGSSYPYEIALGAVELIAGALLFCPRTSTLGAMLAFASMAQVLVLNLTFDVSAKILSFQVLGLALVLLAPQAQRLTALLILGKPSQLATQPVLFDHPRANKAATAVQVGLGVWILAGSLLLAGVDWSRYGDGRSKPELYGIWTVTAFSIDGASLPPLTTQRQRWQRLIIEDQSTLRYQQMDGVLVARPAVIDAHTITQLAAAAPTTLTIDRIGPNQMRLNGQLDGHRAAINLRRLDLGQFLRNRNAFHWVQQYPDNPLED